MHLTAMGKTVHAVGVPMDSIDFDFAATDVSAMLWRLDALLAQSRVLAAEHDAVLNEAEALITTIGDVATRLDAATEQSSAALHATAGGRCSPPDEDAAHALRIAT
jgi:hypothetical protein